MTASDKFDDLVAHIARLRDPIDGCPWDRAQDHVSLRPYMLEEAHEAIAAIDSGNRDALKDELGDVLLQVVLHAQIAAEAGSFDIRDVIDGLRNKLIRRHPHVFGDEANDLPTILKRWDDIKSQEHRHAMPLPPLVEARKLVEERVVRNGESLERKQLTPEQRVGMTLLRAVAESWKAGFEPELALRKAMDVVRGSAEEIS